VGGNDQPQNNQPNSLAGILPSQVPFNFESSLYKGYQGYKKKAFSQEVRLLACKKNYQCMLEEK